MKTEARLEARASVLFHSIPCAPPHRSQIAGLCSYSLNNSPFAASLVTGGDEPKG